MIRSLMIPYPTPCTICPANHPPMRPTASITVRLSFDMTPLSIFAMARTATIPMSQKPQRPP
jgi:hypothetical protein